jgi:ElaB/YqjD/DUF883 family membrane-anchored ribosome-binding protein
MATPRKSDTDPENSDPVQAEIAALRADLAELGTHVARIGRHRAAGLKAAAGSAAQEQYAKGEAVLEDVIGEFRSLEDELVEATRQRPFAALGLAALLGFLFGVLFRR